MLRYKKRTSEADAETEADGNHDGSDTPAGYVTLSSTARQTGAWQLPLDEEAGRACDCTSRSEELEWFVGGTSVGKNLVTVERIFYVAWKRGEYSVFAGVVSVNLVGLGGAV